MFKSVLMPLAIGTTMALGGAAFADGITKHPPVDAQAATKPAGTPTQTAADMKPRYKNTEDFKKGVSGEAVKPGAQESKARYKNTEDFKKGVRDRAVNPDAPIDKERYRNTKEAPDAEKEMTK